jgi:hypothetical protein
MAPKRKAEAGTTVEPVKAMKAVATSASALRVTVEACKS